MTLLARAIIRTTGFPGAPGINVLHFSEGTSGGGAWGQSVVDDLFGELESLCSALKNIGAPSTVREVLPDLSIIDSATGKLVDVKAPTAVPQLFPTPSNEPGDLPRAVCALARFGTSTFLNGRRLKGHAFIGPLSGTSITAQGDIGETPMAVITDAFVALTSGLGPRLAVFHRPTPGNSDGTWADVNVVSVRARASYLNSRAV